jgi:hypothetical protein
MYLGYQNMNLIERWGFYFGSEADSNLRRRFTVVNMQVTGSGAKKLPAEARFDASFCVSLLVRPPLPRKESQFIWGFFLGCWARIRTDDADLL